MVTIPDYSYRVLIIGGSRSGKTYSLYNLISEQPDNDKHHIYIYIYKFLINKQESAGLKHFNNYKAFVKCSNDMNDIYKDIEEYNSNKKRKMLLAFDDMIVDMVSNKKLNPIVTELFSTGGKPNIYLVFIAQSYFTVPKNIRLNATRRFIMKIPNKRELQQIAFNHSSNTDFQEVMNIYKKYCKTIFFLVIDTTATSNISSRFRKNLLERT